MRHADKSIQSNGSSAAGEWLAGDDQQTRRLADRRNLRLLIAAQGHGYAGSVSNCEFRVSVELKCHGTCVFCTAYAHGASRKRGYSSPRHRNTLGLNFEPSNVSVSGSKYKPTLRDTIPRVPVGLLTKRHHVLLIYTHYMRTASGSVAFSINTYSQCRRFGRHND